jgi:hypothetical protein
MNLDQQAYKAQFKRYRDLLYTAAPVLSVYPGAVEAQDSDSTTQVTVTDTVRRVMSVWLVTDAGYTGTNYYADPKAENFTGSVITLDSALPTSSTPVNVAYYADCPACGWDAQQKAGRDSACATCDGLGMTLALGTAVSVPVKRLKKGEPSEGTVAIGEIPEGVVLLTMSADYENLLKAAIQLEWEGKELVIHEDPTGNLSIRRMYNGAGVSTVIRVMTEYKPIQG